MYRYLYGILHYGSKIGKDGQTLVYPVEIREALRKRFPPKDGATHDAQYNEETSQVKKYLTNTF